MTASNLSIVMAPNLLYQATYSEDGGTGNLPKLDFAESNLVNDIIESIIVNVEFYFGDANVDFFQDPPTLIGSKKMASMKTPNILSSSIVRAGKSAGSLTVRESVSSDASWVNTSSGSSSVTSGTPKTFNNSNRGPTVLGDQQVKSNHSSNPQSTGNPNNTPKHQHPPVPAQRTPVPKPRGSKSGYGKANPPPRPVDRPRNVTDESSNSSNSVQTPEKSSKTITKL